MSYKPNFCTFGCERKNINSFEIAAAIFKWYMRNVNLPLKKYCKSAKLLTKT